MYLVTYIEIILCAQYGIYLQVASQLDWKHNVTNNIIVRYLAFACKTRDATHAIDVRETITQFY